MDSLSPASLASSASARVKAVPKTKKKPTSSSPSCTPAQQSPVSLLLAAQVPAISSDSEGSLDDVVFDSTGKHDLIQSATIAMQLQHVSSSFSSSSAVHDDSGRGSYLKACSDLRIKPNIRILQALDCPVMDLTDCGLRPHDAQALAACFPTNTKCTAVLLDNNRLGDVGVAAVLHALAENPRITSLSSACAARPIEHNRIVVILCGSYNGITARSAEALKSFGAKNIKCQSLCLRGNRLGDAGVKALADGVSSNNSCALVELDVSDNKISTQGGQAIGQLMKDNRSITDLDVSYNCMRPPASAAVLQALQHNNCITVLSIGWNGVGSQGCQALAAALRVNRTLHSIDLENTRLSGPDCTVLADGLLCNEAITAIRLDSNPLGDDTRLILRALQRKTNPVQYISTNNCSFDSEKSVVSFNAANTSGHYRLDLSSPADFKIAQALAQAAAPSKGEAFRNESIDGVRFVVSGKYSPPSSGIFECDFVHLDAAPPRLSALSRAEFAEFNKQLRACGTDLARLASLRLMCNTAYFDALQALSLLLVFGHEFQREAAAVMLFSRVVAPEMFPAVLGACFADASKLRLQQRLGPSVCFDSQGPGGPIRYWADMQKQRDRALILQLSNILTEDKAASATNVRVTGPPPPLPPAAPDAPPPPKLPAIVTTVLPELPKDMAAMPKEGVMELVFIHPGTGRREQLLRILSEQKEARVAASVKVDISESQEWSTFVKSRPSSRGPSRPSSQGSRSSRPGSRSGGVSLGGGKAGSVVLTMDEFEATGTDLEKMTIHDDESDGGD